MAKILPKGKKVTGTKKKDKIVSTGKGVWKKALTVNAGKGNDVINFKKSNYKNTLNGQDGKDIIYGGKKNDKITGGKGNDKIYTGKGTNTLIINKGDGNDTIYHQGKKTVIKVNKAKSSDTQAFSQKGNDLVMTYTHGGTKTKEVLTFKNYYKGNKNIYLGKQKLENLINSKGMTITGSGNITGTNGNDVITGSAGSDTINVPAGNNKIDGGAGNDVINAGTGSDTITVSSGNNKINGGAGNDNITGGSGNDTIYGGAGNDIINAGKGNNQIIFNKGDGVDTIYAGGGIDTLVFNDEHLSDTGFPASLYAMFDENNENDLIIYHNDGSDKYTWAVLKDYGTGEHSSQWLNIDGKNIRTDSLIKKNNMSTDPSFGYHNLYYGTNRPDLMNVIGDAYHVLNMPSIRGYGGDDVINIGNAERFYLDTGKGNDYINITDISSGTVHLTAGNGDDTLNGLWNIYERQGLILDPITTYDEHGNPVGDDSLLVRRNGNFSYILGEHSGEDFEDLTIKLTNGETFTVYEYFNSHVNSDLLTFKGIDSDGHTFVERVSSYLVTEVPTVAELNSSKTDYTDLSGGMHVVTANDSGEYHIKLGDSNNNVISVNNGESYNIELGNGSGSEIVVGDYFADEALEAYADVKVGNGDKNSIALFKTGSYTGVTVGDGNGNSIYLDTSVSSSEPVNTSAGINVGYGDSNEIDITNDGTTIIRIGNGDNNVIYSHGSGYTNINASEGTKYYNGEEDTVIGSCYMDVGYNNGDTMSTTQIRSFGNDTIKGVGTVNVNAENAATTRKIFKTNFAQREVSTKSQTIVNLIDNTTLETYNDIHIELQPKPEIGFYTTYYSFVSEPSLGAVSDYSSYDLVYGAFDASGNYVDGEIVIKDALFPVIPLLGSGPVSYSPRLNLEDNFILYNNSNEGFGLSNEIQLYDMARVGSHEFIHSRDIVFNGGKALLVNGNDAIGENNGNDSIIVYGAAVNAKGGINDIISCGNDSINVTGTDNIYFGSDEEGVSTNKDIYLTSTGQANIENIMGVGSTFIRYENNVKDVMFSFYGGTENTSNSGECGYLTLHAFDADGNIINRGDKIYGQMNGVYLDFDLGDGSLSGAPIDSKLSVKYNKDVVRTLGEMVRYYDMNNTTANHYFDGYDTGTYNLGRKIFVQGSDSADEYYWEFGGNITINEKAGNDELDIYSDTGASSLGFLFDVSVTRDNDNTIISSSIGNDLILASRFGTTHDEFDKLFSTDADTRNSASTLVIKDYFDENGASIETIKAYDSHYTDILDYDKLTASIDNNPILQEVTAWLGNHTDYSSVTDAINRCTDQDALSQLAQCYYNSNFGNYWIS